jgi:hypothetical protein
MNGTVVGLVSVLGFFKVAAMEEIGGQVDRSTRQRETNAGQRRGNAWRERLAF